MVRNEREHARNSVFNSWGFIVGASALTLSACTLYTVAQNTGQRTPPHFPQGTLRLPWPNGNSHPFLTPADKVSQLRCGELKTFLGNLYDDSADENPQVSTPDSYLQSYQEASGAHHASRLAIQATIRQVKDGRIVYCP